MKIKIRKAKKTDSKEIIRLVNELAKFEKLAPPTPTAKKRLINDAFGKKPLFYVLLAETKSNIAGYAFYFFTYSSFKARKTLYLEDIFVTEGMRRFGIGKLFFNEMIKISKKEKCARMEWCVLNWNKNAINFYDKLGAKPLKEWIYYRFQVTG
jgi:GNAT superfamily N-acetyltransferase